MGLSNELSCEAGSFSYCSNPQSFLQSEILRLHFSALEPWVAWSVSLPICSSLFICTQMWDLPVCQTPPCHKSSTQLLVSATVTGLDESFFFNSLVVELPYSSIFLQVWLFFVFKLLFSFFWLCKEAKCIYLHLPWQGSP